MFVRTTIISVDIFRLLFPALLIRPYQADLDTSRVPYIFQIGKIIFSGRVGETAKALQTLRTLQQNLRPPTEKLSL